MSAAARALLPALLVLLTVGASRPAGGASFLYVRGEPGEPVTRGRQYLVRDAEGLDAYAIANGLRFLWSGGGFWFVDVGGPNGIPLSPGVYEGATRFGDAAAPQLSVSGAGVGCNTSSGRFVVHEAVFDETGSPRAFSMDFEQYCDTFESPLRGALRFHAGDLGCADAADGTPCDDGDLCSTGDVCGSGVCAGVETTGGDCAAPAACQAIGICDRLTGVCGSTAVPDGTTCDDGNACSVGDQCLLGACVSSDEPVVCDDGSQCTTDRCDPLQGCVHDPVPGTCWVFRAVFRAVGTGSAFGRTARCTLACRSPITTTLILGPDGTYRVPGVASFPCPTGQQVTIPDEVGITQPRRRGRLALQPSNSEELRRAALECVAGSVQRLPKGRGWIRPAADGQSLLGVSRLHAKVRAQIPVSVSLVTRFKAVPGLTPDGTPVEPPTVAPRLPDCTATLRPRCSVY
jgi:hypothetical protein